MKKTRMSNRGKTYGQKEMLLSFYSGRHNSCNRILVDIIHFDRSKPYWSVFDFYDMKHLIYFGHHQ